jgi:hypothetical protein
LNSITDENEKILLENYQATLKRTEEMWATLFDEKAKLSSLNYEKLTYALEKELETNEYELKRIDMTLSQLKDSYENAVERLKAMISDEDNNQFNSHQNNAGLYVNLWNDLEKQYANKDIDTSKYVEGLKQVESGLLNEI